MAEFLLAALPIVEDLNVLSELLGAHPVGDSPHWTQLGWFLPILLLYRLF